MDALASALDPITAQRLAEAGHLSPETYNRYQDLQRAETLDPQLVNAVIQAESSGNPNAVSSKGAQGLMQIMPETGAEVARKLGMSSYDLKNPDDNKKIGTAYLQELMQKYGGDTELALAAYNAGMGRVDKVLGSTVGDRSDILAALPEETRSYVPKVMSQYAQLAQSPTPITEADVDNVAKQATAEHVAEQDALKIQEAAIADAALAGATKAQEEQSYYNETIKAQQVQQEQNRQRRMEDERQLAEGDRYVREAQTSFEAAVNAPNSDWWAKQSTGNKILAGIGIALGGFAQGLKGGGSNSALDIIQGAIQADIDAQKEDIENKKDVLVSRRTLYQEMRQRLQDKDEAEAAAQEAAWRTVGLKVNEIAANAKSKEVIANAQLAIGEIKQKADEWKVKRAEIVANRPDVRASIQQQVLRGEASPNLLSKEDRERFVPGVGFAIDGPTARALGDQYAGYKNIMNALDGIKKLREKEGGVVEWAEGGVQRARYSALYQKAVEGMKAMGKYGALDVGALRLAEMGVPSPDDLLKFSFRKNLGLTKDPYIEKINQAQDLLDQQWQTEITPRLTDRIGTVSPKQLNLTPGANPNAVNGATNGQ